jgi:hypothetical protein
LDPTYERVLNEIGLADRDHAHRLLQCLTVAIRPLHVEELAEILVFDFDGAEGATPNVSGAWRREDRQKSVLSICSGLITLVSDGDSRVIQFSHFSVKEFLTSDRLATSKRDTSHFHIKPEAAHTTLAQACLGILLQLDGSSNDNDVEDIFPLTGYASRHWVGHAQFGLVSSRIEDGMRRLFDSTKPYFSAWLQLHDIDETWDNFGTYETTERGSPLYYASLCGFRDLAAYIILTHPEQVNATGGRNYSPLAAALHKRHFDVAELLYQHGAGVDVTGFTSHTPLQVASAQRLIDVVRWLLDHGADDQDNLSTPILGPTNGDLEVGEPLLPPSVQINAANYTSYMPVNAAIENLKADEILTSHNYDSEIPSRETSSSPLTLHHSHNQSSMPPSPATHPSSACDSRAWASLIRRARAVARARCRCQYYSAYHLNEVGRSTGDHWSECATSRRLPCCRRHSGNNCTGPFSVRHPHPSAFALTSYVPGASWRPKVVRRWNRYAPVDSVGQLEGQGRDSYRAGGGIYPHTLCASISHYKFY